MKKKLTFYLKYFTTYNLNQASAMVGFYDSYEMLKNAELYLVGSYSTLNWSESTWDSKLRKHLSSVQFIHIFSQHWNTLMAKINTMEGNVPIAKLI